MIESYHSFKFMCFEIADVFDHHTSSFSCFAVRNCYTDFVLFSISTVAFQAAKFVVIAVSQLLG